MGTFAALFLALGHTLQTILNRSGSLVLYLIGVRSELCGQLCGQHLRAASLT
jgi:hypothetical protein